MFHVSEGVFHGKRCDDAAEIDELTLRKNLDILVDVAKLSPRPFVVAFAADG